MFSVKMTSLVAVATFLVASVAFGQSSGNFSASTVNSACTLNTSTGVLTPGCSPTSNGTQCAVLSNPIKVSNANGLALLITPSMVTGLFTDTKINSQFSTSNADVGVQVCVQVFPAGSTTPLSGVVFGGDSNGCVVYDQRFQQISSGLFSQISSCVPTVVLLSGVPETCTTDADCAAITGETVFCNNPSGGTGTGVCEAFNSNCNFELILSTLSAHSYNYIVVPPGQGSFNVTATWSLIGVSTTGPSDVAACTGPGTLTTTQVMAFTNSGVLPH
jgi:hypothetical protein